MMPQARVRVLRYDGVKMETGKRLNIVTLDSMRTTRYSRNPRIARTLIEFGWVRELNEGVQRIYGEMQRMLLHDPTFSEPDDVRVQLTLENNIVARTTRIASTQKAPRPLVITVHRSTFREPNLTRRSLSILSGGQGIISCPPFGKYTYSLTFTPRFTGHALRIR